MTDLPTVAAEAETVIKDVMKVEPMIISGIGMFVPGAAPITAMIQPMILMAIPFVERALEDIQKNNSGDIFEAVIELIQHVSVGHPNSPTLSQVSASLAAQASARPDQVGG
jgi:hypothetical protein